MRKRVANRAAERRLTMSDFIQFKTNQGDIWLRPSAIIGVARETTRTTAMRLVDGKVYNVAGSPKDVLDVLGATFTSKVTRRSRGALRSRGAGPSGGTPPRSTGLLLPSHAPPLVVLALAQLREDTSLLTLFLEATDSAVDRLVLLDAHPCHAQYSPPSEGRGFDGGASPRDTLAAP